jgi:hypothetical protein
MAPKTDNMKKELEPFVKEYIKAINDNNAAVFAGAGLSIPAGYVNWKGLLKDIAEELGLEIDKEDDLIALAQYHVTKTQSRGGINQKILEEFSKGAVLTRNHQLLAQLPIQYYWTTNYDNLIERALDAANKSVDAKLAPENLSLSKPRRDAIVYKMHGDISLPHKAVLTKDDYENYHAERQLFTTALQGDLVSKTFLFIGFSFDDPNLSYILSRIRVLLGENKRTHYCFLRQPQESDYVNKGHAPDKAAELCRYDRLKLDYRKEDLRRYGIHALLIDDFAEITEVLELLNKKLRRRNIFISGAAHEYGHWGSEAANALVYELSRELVKNHYRLISGFGKGIGSSVVNGVLAHVFSTKYQHLDESIILRPFPQLVPPDVDKKQLWTNYRTEMVEVAGIAVFLFGNRLTDGAVMESQGVIEEFELSVARGALPIPIGATGYAAEKIWQLVSNDLPKYGYVSGAMQQAFRALNDRTKSAKELINEVEKIVNLCQ